MNCKHYKFNNLQDNRISFLAKIILEDAHEKRKKGRKEIKRILHYRKIFKIEEK